MKLDLTEEELKELEQQLSHPDGTNGLQVAEQMHKTNIGMTLSALSALDIQDNQHILELGHGNAGHVSQLWSYAEQLQYTGLEISTTMQQEAIRMNQQSVDQGKATFQLYDGLQLPFDQPCFDRVFTVNTIYFWQDHVGLLRQIKQVMIAGGLFTICFAQKEFMQKLPFVNDKFQLFDHQRIKALALEAGFTIRELEDHAEVVESKSGEKVNRLYTVAILEKK